jgi:hypothetical protein
MGIFLLGIKAADLKPLRQAAGADLRARDKIRTPGGRNFWDRPRRKNAATVVEFSRYSVTVNMSDVVYTCGREQLRGFSGRR